MTWANQPALTDVRLTETSARPLDENGCEPPTQGRLLGPVRTEPAGPFSGVGSLSFAARGLDRVPRNVHHNTRLTQVPRRTRMPLIVPMVAIHLLAAVFWVGGMAFAYMVLRPAAAALDPPGRLLLWRRVFARFLPWVGVSIVVLLLSGFGMIFLIFGQPSNAG